MNEYKIEKGHKIPPPKRNELPIDWGTIEHGDSMLVYEKAEANHVFNCFKRARRINSNLKRFDTRQKTLGRGKGVRIFFVDQDKETEEMVNYIKSRLKIKEPTAE